MPAYSHHIGPDPFKTGSPPQPPRSWWRPTLNTDRFKDFIAYVACHRGHVCTLSTRNHKITAQGVVTPSLVCPTTGCDGHDVGVVLTDWTPAPGHDA